MRFAFIAFGWLVLLGCATDQEMILEPAADLNPNNTGQATTLEIRVYKLKRKDKFNGADFKKLWEDEKAALEDDMVEREQLTLFPGKPVTHVVHMQEDTNFVGVMGCFNKEEEGWRVVVEKDKVADWKYQFSGYRITLAKK